MKAKILDGKKLSEKILENLKKEIKSRRLKLRLAVVLVGENPISEIYIREKQKACEKVGVDFKLFKFPSKISKDYLEKEIAQIVKNHQNSGAIIQLPLPKNINAQEILNIVSSEKDIDVLSENSLGKFYTGNLPILPPVVGGISYLLKEYKIPVKGKNVVVAGVGRLVGKPLTVWLLREGATVSAVNEFTKNISFFTKNADILISGVGKQGLIKGETIKRGAVVIDVGTSEEGEGVGGDVDFNSVSKKASYIAPVPGGVGPMTVACLLENLVKLHKTP